MYTNQNNALYTNIILSRVACNLEYKYLEKFYLEFILTSNFPATFILKKNDGNLEINLEKVSLKKAVGNLI